MESISNKSEIEITTSTNSNSSISNKKNKSVHFSKVLLNPKNEIIINNMMRKYSYEPKIYIKNFVPVLRPKKESKIIPSKLTLYPKRKITLTISEPSSDKEDNISDNEELNLSNSFVNSVISDSSSDEDKNEINHARKNLTKIRKYSSLRNKSKENIKAIKTDKINLNNDENINIEKKEYNNLTIKKLDYNIKNYISKKSYVILSSLQKEENITVDNQKRNRINSFSILETLQNKLKLEKKFI